MSIIEQREHVEWSNTWIEDATDFSKKRILIIGGSGAREFRSSFSKFLPDYAVDLICSSANFEDTLLYDLCDMYFKNTEYKYSFIILNIGGKHGLHLKTADSKEDQQRFIQGFEKFLSYVLPQCSKLISLTTAPGVLKDNFKKFDENLNREIRMRNKLLSDYMAGKQYNTIDLYDFVVRKKFKYRDDQHFATKKIQRTISEFIILQLIENNMISPQDFKKKPNGWQRFLAAFQRKCK